MERVEKGLKHLFDEYERARRDPNPPKGFYQEIRKLTEEVLEKEILAPSREYLRLNEGMLTQATATNQQLAERLTVWLVALGLSGSVGGLLAGWVIASAVRRAMMRTEERLRDTAEQLTRAVPETSHPEDAQQQQDTLERVATSVSAVLRRLEKSEQDALRAEQLASVGQMAAGIAHEVRNPLMAIKLLIQAAAERAGGLKPRDVRVLEDEIRRLEGIVSGFLDFARPPRPEPRDVDVRALVEQVAENFRPRAEAQGVTLAIRADPDAHVSADPNQLRQVLYNLLFNALEAQPDGGSIRITAEAASGDGGLAITVADDGPGVPPELGERVFDPFVSTKETGTGLGLSVCRRIAESHGGTLTAEPRAKGAAFVLTLPPARIPVAV
jgi:signal transduction histidine kinase